MQHERTNCNNLLVWHMIFHCITVFVYNYSCFSSCIQYAHISVC